MTTDLVQELTRLINEDMAQLNKTITITPEDTRRLLITAADATLIAATKGQMKNTLTTKEIGYITAALMFDQKGFNRGAVLHPKRKR